MDEKKQNDMNSMQENSESDLKVLQVKLKQLDECLNVKQLKETMDQGREYIELIEQNTDVIMILGNTGVGKSTTICYLCGAEMVEKEIEVQETVDGEIMKAKRKVIDSKEPFENFVIGHLQASQTSFINIMDLPDSDDLVICDVPGFEDSRGAAIDLSNTICLNQAIKKIEKLRIVLLLKYEEVLAQRGKLIKEILLLISGCFKQGKFEENINKIQVHYTHAKGKDLGKDIYPILIQVQNEIKKEQDQSQAIALLNHMIKLVCPQSLEQQQDENQENQSKSKRKKQSSKNIFKSMIIDPLNSLQKNKILTMIAETKEVQFQNPGEILEFKPNQSTYQNLKQFLDKIKYFVTEFMDQKKYILAFEVLKQIQILQEYIQLDDVNQCINDICQKFKVFLKQKEQTIKSTLSQTLTSNSQFYQNFKDQIKEFLLLIQLWDKEKELYFQKKEIQQISQDKFNELIENTVNEYWESQLKTVEQKSIFDKINFFSIFHDQLQSLLKEFENLEDLKDDYYNALDKFIAKQQSECQEKIDTFLRGKEQSGNKNQDQQTQQKFDRNDLLDQIFYSFHILQLLQTKFGEFKQDYQNIKKNKITYFEEKLKALSNMIKIDLNKLISYLQDSVNKQLTKTCDSISYNSLQESIYVFQILIGNVQATKLFPELVEVYCELMNNCNQEIIQLIDALSEKLKKQIKSQQLKKWKNYLISIDQLVSLISKQIKILKLQQIEKVTQADFEQKYTQFKSLLLNQANDIVLEINKCTKILKKTDTEQDLQLLTGNKHKSDALQQQNMQNTQNVIDSLPDMSSITKILDKLKNNINLIKDLGWMDEYFNTDFVSRCEEKAKKRVVKYLENLIKKINKMIPNIRNDVTIWLSIGFNYSQVLQISQFSEDIEEFTKLATECSQKVNQQLDTFEQECEELQKQFQTSPFDYQNSIKQLSFKIQQLQSLTEFAGLDSRIDKILLNQDKVSRAWDQYIKKIFDNLQKDCQCDLFYNKTNEDLVKINEQLNMFQYIQEFQELNCISVPNINKNLSLYDYLINLIKESFEELSQIKQQHISSKAIKEAEKIDVFIKMSSKTLRNHIPDLTSQLMNFNELSKLLSLEMETNFKERMWSPISDFIKQNAKIENSHLLIQIEFLKQKIIELHNTEFESLESTIYSLSQNKFEQSFLNILTQKLRLITDLKKHFSQILNSEFYKEKEKLIYDTMINMMDKLHENINYNIKERKFKQMNLLCIHFLRVQESYLHSFLANIIDEESRKTKNTNNKTQESQKYITNFPQILRNQLLELNFDLNSNSCLNQLKELKQIKDDTDNSIIQLLQIYVDKYDQIIKQINDKIDEKENNVKKCIQDEQIKQGQAELDQIRVLTNKFAEFIDYNQEKKLDLEEQLKEKQEEIEHDLCERLNSIDNQQKVDDLKKDIKEKYDKKVNPTIFNYIKKQFDIICNLQIKQIEEKLLSWSQYSEEIPEELAKIRFLLQIGHLSDDLPELQNKVQKITQKIMKQVKDTFSSTKVKITQTKSLSEYDIINFCGGLKSINIISHIQNVQIDKKIISQAQSEFKQINESLANQIRDTYNTFRVNYENLEFHKLQYSLSEIKKLNSIITFIKTTDLEQLNELNLSKELIAYKVSEDILTQKQAEEKIDKLMSGLEKESQEHFKRKEYGQFSRKLKSIKELKTLNSTYGSQYDRLLNEFTELLNSMAKKITEKIEMELFDKELQVMFSQLQKMSSQMNDIPEIGGLIDSVKNHSTGFIKKKLEQSKEKFETLMKNTASTAAKGETLIKIAKLCDDVPIIQNEVDQTLRACMDNYLIDTANRDKNISELWDYFQQKNDDIGNQIIRTIPHFNQQNQTDRQKKTEATHNSNYVLSRYKLLSDSDNSFNSEQKQTFKEKKFAYLKQEEKDQLEKMYNIYSKKYQELIETYTKKKIGQKKEILDQIKENTKLKYQIANWNDKTKIQMNNLFSMISAYWSLMSIKEDDSSFSPTTILKQLHASQIFSIMFLLGFDKTDAWMMGGTQLNKTTFDNQLIQILTGEGKSIILGFLAALFALIGYNVDVACYSKYLSQRDYEDFLPLFKELGIDSQVCYGTFRDLSEKIINREGDLREMSQNLLKGVQNQRNEDNITKSILLIDEVDVFFSSNFYGQTYNPATLFQHPHLEYIMETLWKNRILNNANLSVDQIRQSTQYKVLVQQYPKFEKFFDMHIRMMAQAIAKIGEHKYDVVNGKIGYKMGASDDSISTDVNFGYSTNFAYFQEFDRRKVSEEDKKRQIGINLKCGYYSYADAPKKYLKILGVTGTLETLHEDSLRIISQYIQVMSAVPSQFGDSRFKFDKAADIKVAMDEDNMFLTLAQMIDKGLKDLRPVLVFFRDTETLGRFKKSTHCKYQNIIIIEPKSENIANLVVKSTRQGQIVFLDRVFGRGTDFQCLDKTIDDKGGILVIQAFFSLDKSEEQQIKGRTARQSRNGQYQLIVNALDLEEDFHIKPEETQQFKESISTIYDGLLDKKRSSVWGKQLKKLNQSISDADQKHKLTEKFLNLLLKNKMDDATKMLIDFNFCEIKTVVTKNYHFVFCLDDSGSMRCTDGTPKTRWQKVVDAIQSFVSERDNSTNGMSQDIVSIIYHESNSIAICKYSPISNVMTAINQNRPRWGGNSFFKALQLVEQILKEEPATHQGNSKIVIFLSDGGDCDSNTQLVNSINSLITMNNTNPGKIVSWWNMGFGPGAEAGVLKQMSQLLAGCGGKYVTALNAVELQTKFTEIAQAEAMFMK